VLLGASCTIKETAALKAQLLERLARPGTIEIDGRGVQRVDTAGLQLLVAFALDCMERNIPFVWRGRSAELEQAVDMLGIAPLLESAGGAAYSVPAG
jgi:anti-anti-sigma regulatory factor